MRRFLLALATASILASAATAQVSTLSNPPGGTVSSLGQLPSIGNNTLLGNISGGSSTPSALTSTQAKTLLFIANTDVSGLGTASTASTGTSGHTLPYLDGSNTFTGDQAVAGQLTLSQGSANQSLVLNPTVNSFSNIQLKGAGSLANGLDILAGSAGGWFSADAITFRNAAQTTAMLTMTTSSATFNGTVAASNLSGTNTGNQTITLTSDVTGSGTGSFATTIAAGAVTTAKMANLSATSLLANPTGSPAAPSAVTLAGGLGFSGTTLTAAGALTPTSVASSGAISGTSIAGTTTILSSGATSGIGYATGAGGTVSQASSRTTGVTLNKACGGITLVSAAGSATASSFTVTDSAVAATDVVVVNQKSGTDKYLTEITNVAAGSFVITSQTTGGTTTETPVFNFCVVKGAAA